MNVYALLLIICFLLFLIILFILATKFDKKIYKKHVLAESKSPNDMFIAFKDGIISKKEYIDYRIKTGTADEMNNKHKIFSTEIDMLKKFINNEITKEEYIKFYEDEKMKYLFCNDGCGGSSHYTTGVFGIKIYK